MKKVLVTGAAGFIGFHLTKTLLSENYEVVGIDNLNSYYDVSLKLDRLKQLGIDPECKIEYDIQLANAKGNFKFIKLNLEDREHLPELFGRYKFDVVCNLAAQAGVRYSIDNPESYIDSNIVGFLNLLECCRNSKIQHLIYASSSSVYGQAVKTPFSIHDMVDSPISLYAATKKSNELMAYTYSHLYQMKTTGLRFFTVYGPWGRPDMAMFLFTDAILNNRPIQVFNNGDLERDFTYIDDIVEGIFKIIDEEDVKDSNKYALYNIGNSRPVKLLDFIEEIERQTGIKAKMDMLPMQPGDVSKTWADVSDLKADYGYAPKTSVEKGVSNFIEWYQNYYKIK